MASESKNIYITDNPTLNSILEQIAERLDRLEGLRPELSEGLMHLDGEKELTTTRDIDVDSITVLGTEIGLNQSLLTTDKPTFAGANLTAARTYETYVIKKVITKTNIADNTATSFARITTTDETGNNDAGGYAVFVKGLVGHGSTGGAFLPNSGNIAIKGFSATFARVLSANGVTGVNTAVSEIVETASAAISAATRDISTVTLTVLESSEYLNDLQITIDLTGTSVQAALVFFEITLIWAGFATAPTITAL
jgi:hypothetical protein